MQVQYLQIVCGKLDVTSVSLNGNYIVITVQIIIIPSSICFQSWGAWLCSNQCVWQPTRSAGFRLLSSPWTESINIKGKIMPELKLQSVFKFLLYVVVLFTCGLTMIIFPHTGELQWNFLIVIGSRINLVKEHYVNCNFIYVLLLIFKEKNSCLDQNVNSCF